MASNTIGLASLPTKSVCMSNFETKPSDILTDAEWKEVETIKPELEACTRWARSLVSDYHKLVWTCQRLCGEQVMSCLRERCRQCRDGNPIPWEHWCDRFDEVQLAKRFVRVSKLDPAEVRRTLDIPEAVLREKLEDPLFEADVIRAFIDEWSCAHALYLNDYSPDPCPEYETTTEQ